MIKIILADDHKMVRKGLRALLSSEPDLKIVAEAENGIQALELVEQFEPDILLLDLIMPGINGLEVMRILYQKPGRTGIIILSMHNEEVYRAEAIRLGAQAYVSKEAPPSYLINCIREAACGKKNAV